MRATAATIRGFAGAVRQQHEKGDAGAGAEQHGGADDVQEFEREVGVISGRPGSPAPRG